MNHFKRGLKMGIPIGIGYISVSFSFGIIAVSLGFTWWQAIIISAVTLTSAGQLAGIYVMASPGQYFTMLVSQVTINLRYSFMAISLSQKVSPRFRKLARALLGFFITDEIFAFAIGEEDIEPAYFFGLALPPYAGWIIGTTLGSVIGNILPEFILNSLCIAFYGIFIAIIIPPARKSRTVLFAVLLSAALSTVFYYAPVLSDIPFGIAISICAIISAVVSAILFPISESTGKDKEAAE